MSGSVLDLALRVNLGVFFAVTVLALSGVVSPDLSRLKLDIAAYDVV